MAAERQFQSAAQGMAVDRGDHRLGAGGEGIDDRVQRRLYVGLAEIADVGAGDECLAAADDHQRHDVGVRGGTLQCV
jgi:hypothetical protein